LLCLVSFSGPSSLPIHAMDSNQSIVNHFQPTNSDYLAAAAKATASEQSLNVIVESESSRVFEHNARFLQKPSKDFIEGKIVYLLNDKFTIFAEAQYKADFNSHSLKSPVLSEKEIDCTKFNSFVIPKHRYVVTDIKPICWNGVNEEVAEDRTNFWKPASIVSLSEALKLCQLGKDASEINRLSPDKVFNKQNVSWCVHSDFVLDYKCRTPPEDEGERRQRPTAYAGLNWTSASIAIAAESAISKKNNKRGSIALANIRETESSDQVKKKRGKRQ